MSSRRRGIGFHVSIAGGLPQAVRRALERECTAFQVFAGNPRGWKMATRPPEEAAAFRRARSEAGLDPLIVHACYLVNPCAPDRRVYGRSVRRMAEELRMASRMGAEFYVLHPGSHRGRPAGWGVRRAARAIATAAERAGRVPAILLENTASTHGPGGSFEALAELLGRLKGAALRVAAGVAVDSAHACAAGYDLSQPDETERLVGDIRATVGLSNLRLLHVNDSRDPPGSRRDRHAHVGRGTIGERGMRHLLRHPALARLPLILETPWESLEADLRNIRTVRRITDGR